MKNLQNSFILLQIVPAVRAGRPFAMREPPICSWHENCIRFSNFLPVICQVSPDFLHEQGSSIYSHAEFKNLHYEKEYFIKKI